MNNYVGKNRSGITVILLSLVTCGIYMYFWLYTTMEDINSATGEQKFNSVGFLIGCILCPPVIYFIYYKIDKSLAELSANEGIDYKENFMLWLLLVLVASVGLWVADYQICEALNKIWDKRNGIA